jgi:ABC-type multidrug transport system fused ATPase/permease subunit
MLRELVSMVPGVFAIAVTGAAVFAIATVASSFALRWVVDHAITPRFRDGHVGTGSVVFGASMVVVVGIVKSVGVVVRRTFAGRTQWGVGSKVRMQVVQRYADQPYAWFEQEATGELVSHAGVDVDAVTNSLGPLPYATGVIVLIVVSAISLLATDLVLGGAAVLLFPLLTGLNIAYQRRVDRPAREAQDHLGSLSALVHESIDGALVVKALGAEAGEQARFAVTATRLRDAKVRVAIMRATFEAVLDVIPALANLMLLVIGAMRIRSGDLTIGAVTSFIFLFTILVWPLRMIGFQLGELPHALAGWERIKGMLASPLVPQPRASITAAPAGLGVALDDVSFSYEPGRAVLRDITLAVPVGATWAIVGPTGSGKSTLLSIISGLVSPTTGSVRVAGAVGGAGRRGDGAVHRSRLVFQEPFLFADTLRANVDIEGDADASQVADALRLAQAAPFVAELPEGLDTIVGERGVSLSGGQRQRIALARALASRPDVLLLDDTTSALDPTTEAHILSGLRGELAHLTTILVASRPSTIALADTVVYLAGGQVLAVGSHDDLLQTVPGYRHLVEAYERDRGAVA